MRTTAYLRRSCGNIIKARFDWRKYCTPQSYYGKVICVTPLHCSYGQIGYAIHFPYSRTPMPEIEYDWELHRLRIDDVHWKEWLEIEENQSGEGLHTS